MSEGCTQILILVSYRNLHMSVRPCSAVARRSKLGRVVDWEEASWEGGQRNPGKVKDVRDAVEVRSLHAYPIERASNRRLGGSWSRFLFLPISCLTQARGSWSCPRSHRNGFSKKIAYSKDSLCIQNLILVGSLRIGTQVQTASRKICQFDRKKDRWKQIKTEFTA